MKKIHKNFVVVSDYNWLPDNLEDSWVDQWCENYLIYDRYHRFPESDKVKHQKNIGQNVYDMFHFFAPELAASLDFFRWRPLWRYCYPFDCRTSPEAALLLF